MPLKEKKQRKNKYTDMDKHWQYWMQDIFIWNFLILVTHTHNFANKHM